MNRMTVVRCHYSNSTDRHEWSEPFPLPLTEDDKVGY